MAEVPVVSSLWVVFDFRAEEAEEDDSGSLVKIVLKKASLEGSHLLRMHVQKTTNWRITELTKVYRTELY